MGTVTRIAAAALAVTCILSLSVLARPASFTRDEQRPILQEQVANVAVENKIILTQTSCGYLEFAINWITHVEDMGIHNWLTIVEDETSLRFINERFPGHAIPASLFTNEALGDGNALYEWGSAAFTKVACARPTYLQVVLGLGYEVVWSDMDAAWLQNFFDLLPSGLDYVGVDDSEIENEQETENACTGLMYFRPSDYGNNLLQAWHDMCIELNQNNQGAFNRVFSAGIRKEMDYYIMPKELYPHGALVEQRQYVHQEDASNRPSGFNPAWIHANYRIGHSNKRQFLKDRLVWKSIASENVPTCPIADNGVFHFPPEAEPAPQEENNMENNPTENPSDNPVENPQAI